jgi:GNAT superfamily N-acetyltransferase
MFEQHWRPSPAAETPQYAWMQRAALRVEIWWTTVRQRGDAPALVDHQTTIRLAVAGDAPAIRACVQAAYARYRERMDREPAPVLADYGALVARGVVWVLVAQQRVAGVMVAYPRPEALFIENVAVDPAVQGQGCGKLLLQFAEQHARDLKLATLSLYTNEVMTENLGFYAHLGFIEVDRRHEDGYDRVYLVKQL